MNQDRINALYRKNKDYYEGTRRELLPFCPDNCRRALDVGCGTGNFGRSVKALCSAEVWGVDISEDCIRTAAQVLDKAFCADIAGRLRLLPDNYFDTIFFNDVLEHLADPYTLLEGIASKLVRDGTVIASIPNLRHHKVLYEMLVKKDFRYAGAGVTDKTHLRFFTRKSMVRMFEGAGYRIIDVTPINKSKSMKPVFYKILTLGLIGGDICYPQYVIRAAKP